MNQFKIASVCLLFSVNAWAIQPRHVPTPEDVTAAPQVEISGTGIGTFDYGQAGNRARPEGLFNFDDSSILVGVAQKLFNNRGIGSFNLGGITTEQSIKGNGNSLFLNQANVDFQSETFEALIGRADNPAVHLIDFPTLRGDDLITLLSALNPFSNGDNVEEHRYSNVGSVTINQGLSYFENIHFQHLINTAGIGTDLGINSFGVNFEYLAPPGLEAFQSFPMWGFGYEHLTPMNQATGGLHQMYGGGVLNLNESVTNRVDLRVQDTLSLGSDLDNFQTVSDTFQANSNTLALAIRYLNRPFGYSGYQISLTSVLKSYLKVDRAQTFGCALTFVKRLGDGFDLTAQYLSQWRNLALAQIQSPAVSYEQVAQLGFVFNFDTTLNRHLAARRTLLNQQHQYIPE